MTRSRLILALLLAAIAIAVLMGSCTWGSDLDTTLLMRVPGSIDKTGLYARHWLSIRPTPAMLIALGLPVLLLTTAVWVSGLCRPRPS